MTPNPLLHEHEERTGRRRPRIGVIDPALVAWPMGLLLLLVALGAWRASEERPRSQPRSDERSTRAFGELRLSIPPGWATLDRTREHVVWGPTDRAHTVTLAGTETGREPLMSVVREVARQSIEALPGTTVVDGPTLVETGEPLPRGDSFVLLELQVDGDDGRPLHVVQAWRRDTRTGLDVVATWTSTDGRWPVDPRDSVPAAAGA